MQEASPQALVLGQPAKRGETCRSFSSLGWHDPSLRIVPAPINLPCKAPELPPALQLIWEPPLKAKAPVHIKSSPCSHTAAAPAGNVPLMLFHIIFHSFLFLSKFCLLISFLMQASQIYVQHMEVLYDHRPHLDSARTLVHNPIF